MLATKPGVLWKGSKSFQLLSPLSSPYAITSVMALLRLSVYVYIHTYVWKSEDDFWKLVLSFHHLYPLSHLTGSLTGTSSPAVPVCEPLEALLCEPEPWPLASGVPRI